MFFSWRNCFIVKIRVDQSFLEGILTFFQKDLKNLVVFSFFSMFFVNILHVIFKTKEEIPMIYTKNLEFFYRFWQKKLNEKKRKINELNKRLFLT